MTKPVEKVAPTGTRRNRRRNSIQLLPPEADFLTEIARKSVIDGRLSFTEIFAKLNDGLRSLGIEPVSRSAFGRWSLSVTDPVERQSLRHPSPYQNIAHALRLLAEAIEQISDQEAA